MAMLYIILFQLSNRIQNQPIALNFDIIYIIGFNIDIETTFKHWFIFELQLQFLIPLRYKFKP